MPSGNGKQIFSRLFHPEEWRKGREYGREGLISGACYGDGVWQGTVFSALGYHRVRVKRENNGWWMSCSCPDRKRRCRHAAALIYYWLREPEAFTPMEELDRQVELLSRAETVELLRLVAREEGNLLRRLLAHRDEEEEKKGVPLGGLLHLIRSLGWETRSPWRSRQVWEERWYNLLLAVEEELSSETGGNKKEAWKGLLLLTEKMLDFVAGFSLEAVTTGYILRLLEPLSVYAELGIPQRVIEKIFAFYLRTPLTTGEEKRFCAFFCRFAGVRGRAVFSNPAGYEAVARACDEEKESQLPLVRIIRLCGELWRPGTEGFQELTGWCLHDCRRLLPLLDFLEEKERYQEAKTLLQAGTDLFTGDGGRYLYRLRLAALHRALGEGREALYLENLNFTERPGREEYFRLKRLAVSTGEWSRIKPGVFRSIAGKAPALYKELQAMEAGNFRGST